MSRPPHREVARPPLCSALTRLAVTALAVLFAPAALPPGSGSLPTGSVRAAQIGESLPGAIPKAPDQVPGFPIPFFRTVDYRPRDGALAPVDIDGDGRVELVVTLPSGLVVLLRRDGTRVAGWPRYFASLPQPAYPVGEPGIGDVDGDGSPEIVVCVASGPAQQAHLFVLRADGTNAPGWPVAVAGPSPGPAACTPGGVLLADLDGDGTREIVRALRGGSVAAFDRNGRPLAGWPVRLGPDWLGRMREINADLAALDADGDGREEVAFVESGPMPRLAVVAGSGTWLPGFPRALAEVVDRHAPAIGDLDGDGALEIVQATLPRPIDATGAALPGTLGSTPGVGDSEPGDPGAGEPGSTEPAAPAAIHRLDRQGREAPGWPVVLSAGGPWGAAVADVDGDGRLDALQQDGDRLLAFDAGGALLPGFPRVLHRDFVHSDTIVPSPWIVADLDGTGAPDFLQTRSNVYLGSAWLRIHAFDEQGRRVAGFPFDAPGLLACSRPVLADLTGSGPVDLVVLGCEQTNGGWSLQAWDLVPR